MWFLAEHALLVGCLYGVIMSLVFHLLPAVKQNGYVQIFYVFGFILVVFNLGRSANLLGSGASIEVVGRMLALLFMGAIVLAFNFVPITAALDTFLTEFMRAVRSDDNLEFRRSYDRAEGAEARGERELAVRLYREYLDEDPSDPVGHRKLAELLLNMDRRDAAIEEFNQALRVCHEPEQEQRTLWRLAEVHEEGGDMQTACDFFERVLRRYPGSRMARYARERLERYGRLNSQNTETP